VLDFAHRLVLQGVAKGDADDCPALRTLVATGLAERTEDGYAVTPAGRVALENLRSSRWERILWPIAAVCVAVLVVDIVIGWLG
jgi:hypothetical protein